MLSVPFIFNTTPMAVCQVVMELATSVFDNLKNKFPQSMTKNQRKFQSLVFYVLALCCPHFFNFISCSLIWHQQTSFFNTKLSNNNQHQKHLWLKQRTELTSSSRTTELVLLSFRTAMVNGCTVVETAFFAFFSPSHMLLWCSARFVGQNSSFYWCHFQERTS